MRRVDHGSSLSGACVLSGNPYLDNKPRASICAGELCAFRKAPDAASAAAAAAERRAGRSGSVNPAGSLAYCRVVNDSRAAQGVPMYRITVEVRLLRFLQPSLTDRVLCT